MLRTVVIYRSTSGFTKRYAEWIAEELKADLFEARKIDGSKLANYNLIVFGGSLHAVGISGIKIIKENRTQLADKKVIVFAVGASPPKENIPEEIATKIFRLSSKRTSSCSILGVDSVLTNWILPIRL
jgi:menaquinone-dependent protoporphyrinogen IX oxidase